MSLKLRPFADVLLGLLLVLAVDVAAFHRGLYFRWLRPDSYSGRVEESSRRFAARRAATPFRQVAVLSNSTGGACISEAVVESQLQEAGWPLAVTNLAQGGSTARSFYLLAKHEAIDATTTAVVVLGLHPMGLEEDENKPDLEIVKTRLELADAATLPLSFREAEKRLQVLTQVFFRTPLFRDDLRDLLADPQARAAAVRKARQEEDARNARGVRRAISSRADLQSVRLDAAGELDLAALEPRIRNNPALVRQLGNVLKRRAQRGDAPGAPMKIEPEQARLLEALVELLHRRGVAVVVAITPQSPYPLPGHHIETLEALLGSLRAKGLAVALYHDRAMLDRIENPRHFRDLLHVNVDGAEIYSRGLADFLAGAFASSELKIEEGRGVLRREEDRAPQDTGGQQDPEE